ncbi:hypothetical protein G3I43_32950 [Streptomyces anulatus]|uniref:Uncharacterized protein n=1 Tax=Streptomyces anulatus TaxID=1892 RepID=A0A6G3T0X7_STRAQ|nr:hypothetical protein [Streptomyces anulatus]NEB88937.1 hypothetical protein [Streptomyces anulatus]
MSADRLAVTAARGEDLRGSPCGPLERAAVLLGALRTIGGTEVRVSGTPVVLYAEVLLRAELTKDEHAKLLEVLALADQFGHSIARLGGERVWASYGSVAHGDHQPHGGGTPPPGASFRSSTASETAVFYTAPSRSHDAEYDPPV